MARIEGWYKNYEKEDELMWTQNKYNPLRLKAYKTGTIWYLVAVHESFGGNGKMLKQTITKERIKKEATKIMRSMSVSPLNQRIRSRK